jgi:hypothetical protein
MGLFALDDSIFKSALTDDSLREQHIRRLRRKRVICAWGSFALLGLWVVCIFRQFIPSVGREVLLFLSLSWWLTSMKYERDMRILIAVREVRKQNGDHATKL